MNGVFHDPSARHEALCLLANPRPFQPSYSCPVGCPHQCMNLLLTRDFSARKDSVKKYLREYRACTRLAIAHRPAPRPGGVPHGQLRLGQPKRDVRPSSSARMRSPLRKGPGQVSLRHEPWFEREPAGESRRRSISLVSRSVEGCRVECTFRLCSSRHCGSIARVNTSNGVGVRVLERL